ncbi:protease II PtrB [Bifidobacterium actinocoloniiforme DSM 22766]|uniref:Protease II PtrB n=1 Tax=Bifidobacterium actinocoloniiforme DSM 22766 TaxID=1437605 RepID=A0A086YZD8_9BIFI|nr:prolyl oligopeptidase family serine peptidase [Bifidobacterium actinocoloniiforme]AKV54978.1 peptidase S9 [Bifidobacterium actinocoloniiforme DSM 22766]KFI39638.1 protease II PtrB [Bifidobacterium actinocoloniiforme DSM 22766]
MTCPNSAPPAFPQPPATPSRPHLRQVHGDAFNDPYEWLRDKDDPAVQTLIKNQKAYCQARLAPLSGLKGQLFDELKSRVEQTDMSVPTRIHGYWYFARTQEGSQYAVQCRLPVVDPDDWEPPVVNPKGQSGSLPGEEVFFDANKEAEGHDFYRLGGLDLSEDGRLLLYCVDTRGDERYDLRLRDLSSGADLPDRIDQVSSGPVLTPDRRWVFYAKVDEAWRPYSVWRHEVGSSAADDVCVFTEADERFWVGVGLSFDESQLVIGTSSKTTSEVLLLPLDNPTGEFRPFIPRREGVEYDVSFASFLGAGPGGANLPLALVYHNADDPNFSVHLIDMSAHQPPYSLSEGTVLAQGSPYGCEAAPEGFQGPVDQPYRDPVNPAILQGARGLSIEGVAIYERFALLGYRADSLMRLAVIPIERAIEDYRAGRPWRFREVKPADGWEDRVWAVAAGDNPSYQAPTLRYTVASYAKPAELRELDPASGHDRLLKRAKVLGDFDPASYGERRVWVQARDGAQVPVSLVWKRGLVPGMDQAGPEGLTRLTLSAPGDLRSMPWPRPAQGAESGADATVKPAAAVAGQGSPLFITGYGAYEIASDPGFSVGRLSLLDRGVLYACVHVRGGGEMGRAWYEQGRRLSKRHTFEDFVDATAALQAAGWADQTRTVAEGGSAGGLLVGAVANMAPQLYAGVEADVPFVDALTSILDPSLPLTVTEWDEWGDPLHDEAVYRYMKSYSPYENVPDKAERLASFGSEHFPRVMATTSLNDTRVLYVEPLKWAARLQESAVGADAIVKVESEGGHGGASGRYRQWEELAEENAFCLSILRPDLV